MNRFQKVASAAVVALVVVIFAGAIVRATGSGLGCPDWPKCWGCWIPPTSVEEVDFDKIDLEKFHRKDASVTLESLRDEFNPVHVWIEYTNRLLATPVSVLTLITWIMSFRFRKTRKRVWVASGSALLLVLVNAGLGAMVVRSGLTPGLITAHMVAAIIMLCVLVYVVYHGGEQEARQLKLSESGGKLVRGLLVGLFLLTVVEGVLGSQVREKTDQLALGHSQQPRSEWIEELEESWIYLVHRSLSWALVGLAAWFFFSWRSARLPAEERGSQSVAPAMIFAIMLAQMVLGVLLAFTNVPPVAQVLHVGLSSILVATEFYLILALRRRAS